MPDAPAFEAISHVTLTVTDLERSVEWYARALSMRRGVDMEGPGWKRVLMLGGKGVVVGLQHHDRTQASDRFDECRVGLDHLSVACPDRAGVAAWLGHLDAVGVAHSDLSQPPANVATCRDPDGIAVELFAPRDA